MSEDFPHVFTMVTTNYVTGTRTETNVRYRFVPILAPDGWTTMGRARQCHEGQDGLLIEDSEARWSEEDLWAAHNERFCLSIGCYGGVEQYVCHAHAPDWQGERLERVEFDHAEDAAAWALRWMANAEAEATRARRVGDKT